MRKQLFIASIMLHSAICAGDLPKEQGVAEQLRETVEQLSRVQSVQSGDEVQPVKSTPAVSEQNPPQKRRWFRGRGTTVIFPRQRGSKFEGRAAADQMEKTISKLEATFERDWFKNGERHWLTPAQRRQLQRDVWLRKTCFGYANSWNDVKRCLDLWDTSALRRIYGWKSERDRFNDGAKKVNALLTSFAHNEGSLPTTIDKARSLQNPRLSALLSQTRSAEKTLTACIGEMLRDGNTSYTQGGNCELVKSQIDEMLKQVKKCESEGIMRSQGMWSTIAQWFGLGSPSDNG